MSPAVSREGPVHRTMEMIYEENGWMEVGSSLHVSWREKKSVQTVTLTQLTKM